MPTRPISFWGEPDAIVNWCEPDFVYSPHVAEFWNSISNIYTIVLGIVLYTHFGKHHKELRFKTTCILIVLVGLGSTAFHGTLRYHFQLLDELPMVYLGASMAYITAEMRSKKQTYKRPWLGPLLIVACIVLTILHVTLKHAELFFALFGILVSPSIVFPFVETGHPPYAKAMRRCFMAVMVGFGCWEVDRFFCEQTQQYQLHAVWHLMTALSGTFWMNANMYLRRQYLGLPARLVYGGLWVSFDKSKAV